VAVIKLRPVIPYSCGLKIVSTWDGICVSHGWSGCHDYGFRGQAIRLVTPKADVSSLWYLDIKGNEWLRFHFTLSSFVKRHDIGSWNEFEIWIWIADRSGRLNDEMKLYSRVVLLNSPLQKRAISFVYIFSSVFANAERISAAAAARFESCQHTSCTDWRFHGFTQILHTNAVTEHWNVPRPYTSKSKMAVFCHRPDDGCSKYLWNVGKLLPDYTPQQPRRQVIFLWTVFRIESSGWGYRVHEWQGCVDQRLSDSQRSYEDFILE
jgi:hypothetical protein